MKRKLSVDKGLRLLLPMVVLIVGCTSLALAQESGPPQTDDAGGVPPGARVPYPPAKLRDLDLLLEQGVIDDPLALGDHVFAWDKILLAWEDEDSSYFTLKTYDVQADLGPPIPKRKEAAPFEVQGTGSMDVVAAYLGGKPGWVTTVSAWEYPQGEIVMSQQGYDSQLNIGYTWPVEIGEKVEGGYVTSTPGWYYYGALIRLASGDFDADGIDEIVLAWEGPNKSLNLKVFDVGTGEKLQPKGRISDETLTGFKFLDVATGDFDKDGDDEIAVAWQGDKLRVKVYDVDRSGQLTAEAKSAGLGPPGQLALATGDFDGDGTDEIAVAFNMDNPPPVVQAEAHLHLYDVEDNLHTLKPKAQAVQESGQYGYPKYAQVIGVGAADFNADGFDEIAFVYAAPDSSSLCYVQVYYYDQDHKWTAGPRLKSNWLTAYGELSMEMGDMNQDGIDEVVAAKVPVSTGLVGDIIQIGIFSVDPNLGAVRQRGLNQGEEHIAERRGSTGHVALAVGGFDGKNVRVGNPAYKQLTDTKQVLAVINAPPKHRDEVDGMVYDVNVTDRCKAPVGPPCTYAKYETEEKTTTTMGLTTTRNWSVGAGASGKYKFIAPSLKAKYGEAFEKTTTSFKSMEFGTQVDADKDDVIVRIQQSLDVWEYPVLAADSDGVQGYILVAWPRIIPGTCDDMGHCNAAVTATIDGRNQASYYRPDHEFGNVLSYSQDAPADIGILVKSDSMRYLGPNSYQMWVIWDDVSTSETKKASSLDLIASLAEEYKDEKKQEEETLGVKGKYAHGQVSVNKVSFEKTTSLRLYIDGIQEQYSYGVQPIIYWTKSDGRLVLDYVVTPGTDTKSAIPTWWQSTYNKPDPAFNLPWKNDPSRPALQLLSREITFDPPAPKDGDVVTVTAKVRNYSLVGVPDVPVRFYAGKPGHGGKRLDDTSIKMLNPMSAVSTQIHFDTTGYSAQKVVDIYAVIDPKRTITEMHTDNNTAYAELPVAPLAEPEGPATLHVAADDIVFEPKNPAAGEIVQVTATVHAQGDTFSHVVVEFWDGELARGGRVIDGRVIPIIRSGESATASILWDTSGLRGSRDVWVVIDRQAEEDITTDNRANRALELAPHWLYLPVAMRE